MNIGAAYVEANTLIVREQLQKAGVRLALCSMPLWASSDIESGKVGATRELLARTRAGHV